MRIDVKKFLFVGAEVDKSRFFEEAQRLGAINFINNSGHAFAETPEALQPYTQSIKILRTLPPMEQEEIDEYSLADGLLKKILGYKEKIDKAEENLRTLKLEEARVRFFGDFSEEDLHYIEKEAGVTIQFFCARKGFKDEMPDYPGLAYIGSDESLEYFISVTKEPAHYDNMIEIKVDRPLGKVKELQEVAKEEIHDNSQKLKKYAKYSQFIHQAFVYQLNRYNLKNNEEFVSVPMEGMFSVEGWVPLNKIGEVHELAHRYHVYMDEVAINENDPVPTYLENKEFGRMGQDLIGIYDTPSSTDKDPSVWVLLWFSLFFAFIVNDGGYGAVYLGLGLYLYYKYPNLKGLKRRVLKLVIVLCTACILWGFLNHAFFGAKFEYGSIFRRVSFTTWLAERKAEWYINHPEEETYKEWVHEIPQLKDAKTGKQFLEQGYIEKDGHKEYKVLHEFTDGILMELSLFIGCLHLVLGMIRYLTRNWMGLGWIMFVVGGYLYFPYYLGVPSFVNYIFQVKPETAGAIGLQLMEIGIPFAIILAVFKHKIAGLAEIMKVIEVFADVLSYLRLYALGLAGAIVAETINDMAAGMPFLIAVVLWILAHLINMGLGIMSGVIHGLRLNFLEWYHYSFEGGGKKFKALELINKD